MQGSGKIISNTRIKTPPGYQNFAALFIFLYKILFQLNHANSLGTLVHWYQNE